MHVIVILYEINLIFNIKQTLINISLYHYITISLYHYINLSLYQYIQISLYNYITISIYQYINIILCNKQGYFYKIVLFLQYAHISVADSKYY